MSDPSDAGSSPSDRLALRFKANSKLIERTEKGLQIYKLPVTETARSEDRKIVKCCIGDSSKLAPQIPEKVLMVVGATGSGKSTLINGMANYILAVEWEDDFRFKLICEGEQSQVHSQTQAITSYSFPKLPCSNLHYHFTVIDTPGFGDTRGLERDKQIADLIKKFFYRKSADGISHLNGIGFVAKSPDGRLTATQKYIIDSILSIFGKDIAKNIFIMTTFADGQDPPVMKAVKTHIDTSKPPIPIEADKLIFFKFNNSALYNKPKSDNPAKSTRRKKTGFDEMYWEMGYGSLDDFFNHLGTTESKSLVQTRAVLDEREKLQVLVQGIHQNVHIGMNEISVMRCHKQVLQDNEAKIRANEDFVYPDWEDRMEQVPLDYGVYVTNCLKCNRTCHFPCRIPKDEDKRGCAAMDSNGNCKICPGHCYWSPHHVNNQFRYENVRVKVFRHSAELKRRYDDAQQDKASAAKMIKKVRMNVKLKFQKVCANIRDAKTCIQRLEEIALRPNPLSEGEYIDLLIKAETDVNHINYLEKAKKLIAIKTTAREGAVPEEMNLDRIVEDLLKDVPIETK